MDWAMKLKSIPLMLMLPTLMLLLAGCGGEPESTLDIEATVEAKVKEILTAVATPYRYRSQMT